MKIWIINGPNLNTLGLREPQIYGMQSFDDYLEDLQKIFPDIELVYFQSNIEGELIDAMQTAAFGEEPADGIVINAGGYSHTSVAIHDCIKMLPCDVIEVHISNIYAREPFRHHSMLSAVCKGVIAGLGLDGYRLAVEALKK